jgi:prepilin-type processing-associated H-X9-DG protein
MSMAEKYAAHGMNLLFADGQVEWVGKEEAEPVIEELEARRNPPNGKP